MIEPSVSGAGGGIRGALRLCIALFIALSVLSPRSLAALQERDEPVELQSAGGTIHGTLLLPSGEGPYPVALIIAGSGPTDRDGNSALLPGANHSLRLLAEGISRNGVASIRYDKRGIGASVSAGLQESDLRFDTYVEDAVDWIEKLQEDPRFSTVSVVGHSEGALIGIVAARRTPVDGVVSVSATARPMADLLRDQLRPQLPPELWEASERILAALLSGETAGDVPAALQVLYRPSVQPYLISILRIDPVEEISGVEAPVLIVHGTTDIQVPPGEALELHGAREGAELVQIEGMNHVLKLVPADPIRQQASYSDPSLPVAPELIDRVSAFLRALDEGDVVP